jgi:hypothetical protein
MLTKSALGFFSNEFWIAPENLRNPEGGRPANLNKNSGFQTWGSYCRDVGVAQQTANRW